MTDKIVEQDLTCIKCGNGKVHVIQTIPYNIVDFALKTTIFPCNSCKHQYYDIEQLIPYKKPSYKNTPPTHD